MKQSLRRLAAPSYRIGAQPQRDVSRLHGLSHNPHEVVAQGVYVSLVSELGREGF